MILLEDIVAYFKTMCIQHPTLLHADTVGQQVFQVSSFDEAFSNFRTAGEEKNFFVRLLKPTLGMIRQNNNARTVYQVGLMVGRYYSRREDQSTEIVDAQSACERIANDFVIWLMEDARAGTGPFADEMAQIDDLNLQGDFWEAGGDGSFAGVLYMLDLPAFRCLDPAGTEYTARVV